MELLAAFIICAAIGGLAFVLLTVWFKKYQELMDAQQEKAIESLKAALSQQTELLIARQQEILNQHGQILKKQHEEALSQSKVQAGLAGGINLEPLMHELESCSKIAEMQVLAQLLPLIGKGQDAEKLISFAISFFRNPDILKGAQSFMNSASTPLRSPASFLPGAEAPQKETEAQVVTEAQAVTEAPKKETEAQAVTEADAAAARLFGSMEETKLEEQANLYEEQDLSLQKGSSGGKLSEGGSKEETANESGIFKLSDDDVGSMFSGILDQESPENNPLSANLNAKGLELNPKNEEEEAAARLFGGMQGNPEAKNIEETTDGSLFKLGDGDMGAMFDNILAENSKDKNLLAELELPNGSFLSGEKGKLNESESLKHVETKDEDSLAQSSGQEAAEAAARLFGGMDNTTAPAAEDKQINNDASGGGLLNVNDEDLNSMFSGVLDQGSKEVNLGTGASASQVLSNAGGGSEENPEAATRKLIENELKDKELKEQEEKAKEEEAERIKAEKEAEERLFGHLFGGTPRVSTSDETEQKRLSEEAEQKRLSEEAEQKRLSEEAEQKRLSEEAEQKRLSEEAEQKRLSEEAEQKRLSEEAEQKRLSEEAERKRLSEEAERKRLSEELEKAKLVQDLADRVSSQKLADSVSQLDTKQLAMEAADKKLAALAGLGTTSEEQQKQFELNRDLEAQKLLEAAESERPQEQLDAATERLMQLEAKGLPMAPSFDTQATVEQPFSEAFTADGNRLFDQGKYAEAEKHYRAALPTLEEVMGREHLAVVEILHKLGIIAFARGKYSDAEETFQQALVRRVLALGGNHPDTVRTLNDLGELYVKRANYNEAKRCLTEALELRRGVHGDEHRATAQTCHDFGKLYLSMGALTDADVMLERAYEIRKKLFGENHQDSAQSQSELGKLALVLDDLPKAERLLGQALSFRKESLGENHPDYAQTLLYYGEYLCRLGKYQEALPLLEHCLSIRKTALSERHPDTATAFNQLGLLNLEMNQLDAAKRSLNQALYIRKTVLGENHPDTAKSMHDFGKLCFWQGTLGDEGKYAEGMPLLEKSFAIRKKILGDDHPDTFESMNSLGAMLTVIGSLPEAEGMLNLALSKRKKLFGTVSHLSVAESDHSLALCLLKQGRYQDARPLLDEEVHIRANVLGHDNPLVSNARIESQRLLAAQS